MKIKNIKIKNRASQPANRPARSTRPNTARVCRLCGQSSVRYSSRGQCSACTPMQQGERTGEQETARNSFRLINRSTSASFFFYSAYTVLSILCNSNRSSNLCFDVVKIRYRVSHRIFWYIFEILNMD